MIGEPTIRGILAIVGAAYEMPVSLICSDRQLPMAEQARHVAMWLSRKLTGESLAAIGRAIGGRDHSTVLTAVRGVDARAEAEPAMRQLLDALTDQVRAEGMRRELTGEAWPAEIDVRVVAAQVLDGRRPADRVSIDETTALCAAVLAVPPSRLELLALQHVLAAATELVEATTRLATHGNRQTLEAQQKAFRTLESAVEAHSSAARASLPKEANQEPRNVQ